MANILINGLNSKTGGGRSILNNYLSLLKTTDTDNHYYVLTPEYENYLKFSNSHLTIIEVKDIYRRTVFSPLANVFVIPRLVKKFRIEKILNFADVIIPTKCFQLLLFDWPYAAYPDNVVWKRMSLRDFAIRSLKLLLIKRNLKYVSSVIVQTSTMKKRLNNIFNLTNLTVIPNAVALENFEGGEIYDFNLPINKRKLLYLTYYYTHKNIEIIIPVAEKLKKLGLPYCLVVSLDRRQHQQARKFLQKVSVLNLQEFIINVGTVPMQRVPSLYKQVDALFMPTLLETYGLPYIEAMYHKKTILTSDLDFAHDVCKDAGYYFDPMDQDSIIETIMAAFSDEEKRSEKIRKGEKILATVPTWEAVFAQYEDMLNTKR
jgi:glycosyltransferase involved in cell wall biosynthesis